MIVTYEGRPRSGKTYRVVYDLLQLPPGKFYIYHNIPGLKHGLIENGLYIENWEQIPGFLTLSKQQEIASYIQREYGRTMVIVIDECHRFGFDKRNTDLEAWLSWHGHEGQQIWLICQSPRTQLHMCYSGLIEYGLRAKRGITTKQFIYQYQVAGEVYKTDRIPEKQSVYNAYTSYNIASQKSKGSPLMFYGLVGLVITVIIMAVNFGWALPSMFGKVHTAQHKKAPGVAHASPSPPPRAAPPPAPSQGVFASYSYAGGYGNRVLLQDVESGALVDLVEVYPEYRMVERDSRGVRLLGPRGILYLKSKHIKVKPEVVNADAGRQQGYGVAGSGSNDALGSSGGLGAQ